MIVKMKSIRSQEERIHLMSLYVASYENIKKKEGKRDINHSSQQRVNNKVSIK